MLFVIKGGLRQQVSEAEFANLYKPNGWVIDKDFSPSVDEVQETVKELKNQHEIRNYLTMVHKEPRKFSDKLFKSEDT